MRARAGGVAAHQPGGSIGASSVGTQQCHSGSSPRRPRAAAARLFRGGWAWRWPTLRAPAAQTHPPPAAVAHPLPQLFFAKVSKTAGEDEIKTLFGEYGTVLDVIIFQSAQGTATSKVRADRKRPGQLPGPRSLAPSWPRAGATLLRGTTDSAESPQWGAISQFLRVKAAGGRDVRVPRPPGAPRRLRRPRATAPARERTDCGRNEAAAAPGSRGQARLSQTPPLATARQQQRPSSSTSGSSDAQERRPAQICRLAATFGKGKPVALCWRCSRLRQSSELTDLRLASPRPMCLGGGHQAPRTQRRRRHPPPPPPTHRLRLQRCFKHASRTRTHTQRRLGARMHGASARAPHAGMRARDHEHARGGGGGHRRTARQVLLEQPRPSHGGHLDGRRAAGPREAAQPPGRARRCVCRAASPGEALSSGQRERAARRRRRLRFPRLQPICCDGRDLAAAVRTMRRATSLPAGRLPALRPQACATRLGGLEAAPTAACRPWWTRRRPGVSPMPSSSLWATFRSATARSSCCRSSSR